MRPINIVILVVTVIESLRAFDLVYITSKGNPCTAWNCCRCSVTQNIVGETQRIGFGSTLGVVLLVISLVPITIFLFQAFRREETVMAVDRRRGDRRGRASRRAAPHAGA